MQPQNSTASNSNPQKQSMMFKHRWFVPVVIAATVGLGILVWEKVLEDRFIPKKFGVVESGKIFRSGQISEHLIEDVLVKNNIKTVIDLNGIEKSGQIRADQQAEMAVCKKLGIEHHRFRLGGDGTGDIEHYAQAIKLIVDCKKAGKEVLVHCAAGAQRTGGVVASYRVLVQKKSPQEAYLELMKYGWKPGKNAILLEYMEANMPRLSQLLVEMDVIDHVPEKIPVVGSQPAKKFH